MTDTAEAAAARAWYAAGCTPIPIRLDGTKAPAGGEWKQHIRDGWPTARERALAEFDAAGPAALAIVCGPTSGNLEMLEFEGLAVRECDALTRMEALADAAGARPLWDRVRAGYLEQSPKGGAHLFYRVAGKPVPGNSKIAQRPAREDEWTPDEATRAAKGLHPRRVLVETRGAGGYVVVAPSRAQASDPAGPFGQQPWTLVWGSPAGIVTITPDERETIIGLARSFDVPIPRANEPGPANPHPRTANFDPPGDRPGDRFAATTPWPDILTPHGWTRVYDHGGRTYWRRPGKTAGVSATTTDDGPGDPGGLWVFSSATEFEPETLYTKFGAYAVLEHAGDYTAAAYALAGSPEREQPPPLSPLWLAAPPAAPETVQGGREAPDPANPYQAAYARLSAALTTSAGLRERPPRRYIVDGLIGEDEVVQVVGASGSMKSFVVLDLVAAVGAGEPWYGHQTTRTNVLVVAAEGGDGMAARTAAYEQARKRAMDGVGFITEPVQVTTRGTRGVLAPSIDWQALTQLVIDNKIGLVVLDTQARSTVGVKENDNSEMGEVFEAVDRFRRLSGATVVLIHHTGKAGTEGRGASAMLGAVHAELKVTRNGKGIDSVVTVTNSKNKDNEEAAPIHLKPQKVTIDGMRDSLGREITSIVLTQMLTPPVQLGDGDDQAEGVDRAPFDLSKAPAVLSLLRVVRHNVDPDTHGATQARHRAHAKALFEDGLAGHVLAPASFDKAWSRARANRLIERRADGWNLSEAGILAAKFAGVDLTQDAPEYANVRTTQARPMGPESRPVASRGVPFPSPEPISDLDAFIDADGSPGTPRDATGRHGTQDETTSDLQNGTPRDATGRDGTGGPSHRTPTDEDDPLRSRGRPSGGDGRKRRT